MRQIFKQMKHAFLVVITMTLPFSTFAFQPKDGFKTGTIELKDGHVLNGEVLPMAKFNQPITLFKNASGAQQTIAFDAIKKVVYGDMELVPATARINGKNTKVYLQVIEKGTATLYKAFFYGVQSMGKNNAVTTFQNTWMVSTPLNGLIALGKSPTEKMLAKALDHPAFNVSPDGNTLHSETDLIQWIQNYNSMAQSQPAPSNEIND